MMQAAIKYMQALYKWALVQACPNDQLDDLCFFLRFFLLSPSTRLPTYSYQMMNPSLSSASSPNDLSESASIASPLASNTMSFSKTTLRSPYRVL